MLFRSQKEFLIKYSALVKSFNTGAINSISALEVAKYAKERNGIMVAGDHLIGYTYDNQGVMKVGTSEWDHYYDVLVDNNLIVPFFYYDLPIAQAYVSNFNTMKIDNFKEYLYDTLYRPKFKIHFTGPKMNLIVYDINSTIIATGAKEVSWTKSEFLNLIG